MRAAELLRARAVDTEGRRLGKVHDILLTRSARTGRWRVDAVLVGPSALAHRLGYASGDVTGPAPLAAAARLLARGTRPIPWTRVVAFADGRLVVRPESREDPESGEAGDD